MRGVEKVVFGLAATLLLSSVGFGIGFAYRHYSIWPTKDVITLSRQTRQFLRTGAWGNENQYFKADVSADQPRAVIHDPGDFLDGFRIFLVYDTELGTYSARLLDSRGVQVHVWPIRYTSLSPGEASQDVNPHVMKVLRDSSIVVNFGTQGRALARLDACGRAIWIARGPYHHSVELDDDGNIWTWGSPDDHESNLQSIYRLEVGSGKIMTEIAMEDVFAASPENAQKLRLSEDFEFLPDDRMNKRLQSDVFHPNDVEPLSAAMAHQHPSFKAGDLLISLRNLDQIAVLDPDTLDIRWVAYGPWRRQHDPDFVGNGLIEVYDNNPGHGRSNLITIEPETGRTETKWSGDDSRFYSASMGKQQRLPNGAHLLVVPDEGRAVELSASGKKLFEYINIAGDNAAGAVLNAQWVPPDYFETESDCAVDF